MLFVFFMYNPHMKTNSILGAFLAFDAKFAI